MDDEAQRQAEEDFRRELAARRRDLEDEFSAKLRELKAQERRRMDRMEADRSDFEQYRREKGKELADREHRLRGREGRVERTTTGGTSDSQELAKLRQEVADLKERRDLLAGRRADLEGKASSARFRLRVATWRMAALMTLAVVGDLVWLVLALKAGGGARTITPVAFLVLVAAAGLWPAPHERKGPGPGAP